MKYGERAIEDAKVQRLEIWDNPNPEKDYEIDITFSEFTCLCPRSGYPDFAIIHIAYVPDRKVVELKALKLYLNGFRNEYMSHEASVNLIYDTLKSAIEPRHMRVIGDFNPRGNVKTVITVGALPPETG